MSYTPEQLRESPLHPWVHEMIAALAEAVNRGGVDPVEVGGAVGLVASTIGVRRC